MKFEQYQDRAIITVHSDGPRGPKGEQGEVGPKGDKGDKGDPGEVTQVEFDSLSQEVTAFKEDYTTQISSIRSNVTNIKAKLKPPIGFSWVNAPINIYKNISGVITTDFDVSDFEYLGVEKTYYVDMVNGKTTNDGLTPETPLSKISDAIRKPDVDVIIIAGGYYPRTSNYIGYGLAAASLTRPISIKAKEGEKVTFSLSDDLVWSKSSGYTNVYQANRSVVSDVYDKSKIDELGDYANLIKKNSIAEVDATKGSWFTDGTIVYVHTSDSRPADINIRAFLTMTELLKITTGASHVYIENINFEGGQTCVTSSALTNPSQTRVYFNNCSFKYAINANGISINGVKECFLQNCLAAKNNLDGFNYHIDNSVIPNVIEVDCVGRHNGLKQTVSLSNNGSSIHDGGKIIRVGGEYFANRGSNVIDVNEGTESWNLGVLAHESDLSYESDFTNGNVGNSKMWLDSCVSYGSAYSLTSNFETYVKNNLFLEPTKIVGTGTVTGY